MTSRETARSAWWNTAHDHARCWWNWEVGSWICPPPTDATRIAATNQLSEQHDLQEQM